MKMGQGLARARSEVLYRGCGIRWIGVRSTLRRDRGSWRLSTICAFNASTTCLNAE